MAISENAAEFVAEKLAAAGFTPFYEYSGEIRSSAVGLTAVYPAAVAVGEVSMSEYSISSAAQCRADVKVRVRAYGAKRGFYGGDTLTEMTETAAAHLFFDSEMIVKKITCGEIKRNLQLGRLERVIEITLCYTVKSMEAAA